MEFSQDIVIYLIGLATTAGTIIARISALEKKVEKHNSVVERTYVLEEKMKVANHRIDDLEEAKHNG
ncbi:hypothetical protein EDD70_1089 [Hydrogenoanaerobacterium saccharovorans]|uniref:Uncharacterized protein n=1 Tax=Hydrogenoanaerobacterium saccharovorans TaxID=474960 RepID=A0A1H8A1G4_9FIRM|nr:hypothetical protein [Hydrogenoanaerobacterium saccharovorans]RPF48274.1 hypothetical protein EDD70_1089 [Hydrogenoanaerobacterium saccharovorans]SEM63678.1 hypothetical protein SAMN05216180_1002 [Hydrogenoanaerobacterium saccharovorans]